MKVTFIGAGRVSDTISERWAKAGHDVVYGLREPSKHKAAKPIAQALDRADSVLLAVPASATLDVVRDHARALDGKIIINATNNSRAAKFNSWAELA
ncbi:MAG: NAD(P)-binding domain-containing protein [Candidatus Dormibacteraceae bacterium]